MAYGGGMISDPVWDMSDQQRYQIEKFRREIFFYDRLYRDRERGLFDQKAWTAWGRQQNDWFTGLKKDLGRIQWNDPAKSAGLTVAGTATGWVVGSALGSFLGPAGTTVGGWLGGAIGGTLAAVNSPWIKTVGLSKEESEAIGISLAAPRTRFVNSRASATMRQATLAAMHNSVYSLRGALQHESQLIHG